MDKGQSDIVVHAFTERFSRAHAKVAEIEGGFVNDPKDRGGATKYGVSLRFLVHEGMIDTDADGVGDFDLDMDGDIDVEDIKRLQPIDAKILFRRCFWDAMNCESWPAPIGEAMFDQGVNGGLFAAKKMLQQAINATLVRRKGYVGLPDPIKVDGVLGDKTRAAFLAVLRLAGAGMPRLIEDYREAAKARYLAIIDRDPSQKRFIVGWISRANALGRV